jgi:peptidoglycan hydrolase CwlO-like protein
MLQNKQNILLVLVIVLIGYNIFTTNSIKTDINKYRDQIELLQTIIDSTKTVNQVIDTKIDSVQQRVFGISKEIHYIDKNINIIKKQTDEKVNTVDKFSNAELEFFFTNRYN